MKDEPPYCLCRAVDKVCRSMPVAEDSKSGNAVRVSQWRLRKAKYCRGMSSGRPGSEGRATEGCPVSIKTKQKT